MISALRLVLFLTSAGIVITPLYVLHTRNDPETRITRQVEAAGSGDLRGVSQESLTEWFKAHPKTAVAIEPQCRDRGEHAPGARWGDTLEGRVCRSAVPIAALAVYGDGIGPGKFAAAN